jgi:CRISPR-associated endoribonuclease Cas6
MRAGDDRTLLVASPKEELLAYVAADLLDERELNIGEMLFHVDSVTSLFPDVGEPNSTGTIETGTGMLIRIQPWKADKYDIEPEEAIFWQPKHSMEPFTTQEKITYTEFGRSTA